MSKKKIAFISREYPPSLRRGGIASYVYDLSHSLVEKGHDVYVITASDNIREEDEYYTDGGVYVIRCKGGDFYVGRSLVSRLLNLIRSRLFFRSYRKEVAKRLQSLDSSVDLDIIEIPEYGAEALYITGSLAKKCLIRYHGTTGLDRFSLRINRDKRGANLEIEVFQRFVRHSFVSQALQSLMLNNGITFKGQTFVVRNSVKDIALCEFRNGYSSKDTLNIVGAGSIGKIKGWDILCDQLSKFSLINPSMQVRLSLYGRIADLPDLKDYSNSRLTIELYGQVERECLFEEYANADICIFPSWFEPMGLTVLEALSVGALVVAGTLGGWNEVIKHGYNGFLIDPRTPHTIQSTLSEILSFE